MSTEGLVEGLMCFIQHKKRSTTVGENVLFCLDDLDWLCLQWANKGKMNGLQKRNSWFFYHIVELDSLTNREERTSVKAWQNGPGDTQEIQQRKM